VGAHFSKPDVAGELTDLYLALFEAWCERQRLIALAYLMHCWPPVNATTGSYSRWYVSLQALEQWHPEGLPNGGNQLILYLLHLLSRQIDVEVECTSTT
jgi:hypothetical protein